MATLLFQTIPPALSTLFGSIDGHIKAGAPVFTGSAGSIAKRKNQNGVEYYVRRFYGGAGTQQETYLGLIGEANVEAEIDALRAQIDEIKALVPDSGYWCAKAFKPPIKRPMRPWRACICMAFLLPALLWSAPMLSAF